jgi:hypothetical protein
LALGLDSLVQAQIQRIEQSESKHPAITHQAVHTSHATMMPSTEAKALEHLAAIVVSTLDILSRDIIYYDSIPFGCLFKCNHGYSDKHLVYHPCLARYLSRLQGTMQVTLDSVNEKIQALPHDIWTDPIEGPILRFKMTYRTPGAILMLTQVTNFLMTVSLITIKHWLKRDFPRTCNASCREI